MEFVKENEVILEKDHLKVQIAKEKLKNDRHHQFTKEKDLLIREKAFTDSQNR